MPESELSPNSCTSNSFVTDSIDDDSLNYLAQPLCVPNDNLNDVPMFLNFTGNLISLNDDCFGNCTSQLSSMFEASNLEAQFKKDYTSQFKPLSTEIPDAPNIPDVKGKLDILDANDNISMCASETVSSTLSTLDQEIGEEESISSFISVNNSEILPAETTRSYSKEFDIPIVNKRRRTTNNGSSKTGKSWVRLVLEEKNEGLSIRRCTHCQTTKTPQWREGPMGKKTLCNACGVRFKSGRLLPEYRPAASPSFDGSKNSNYHKRVLKMRGHDNGKGKKIKGHEYILVG